MTTALLGCSGTATPKAATLQPVRHQRFVRVLGKVIVKGEDGVVLPVKDAVVAATPRDFRPERVASLPVTKTDADGNFSFDVDHGAYTISATGAGFLAAGVELTAAPDASPPPIELRLHKVQSDVLELHGTLVDAQRKPQADARVAARRLDSDAGEVYLARSGADGTFVMTVPRAKYALVSASQSLLSRELIVPADALNSHDTDLILVPAVDPPASERVVAWLRQRAVPLERAGDDIRLPDAEGVLRVVGDARVVGLGESSHGGHEFALTKVRLFQTLVDKAGFSVFAIEANHPECVDIDRWVNGGAGDPAVLLSRLRFWVTDIDELLELITWMRAYNAQPAHPRKLHFVGVDMQSSPRAAARVIEYLETVDPKLAREVAPELTPLASEFQFESYRRLPQALRDRAAAAVARIAGALEERQTQYRRLDSATAWSTARQMARTLTQAVQLKACHRPACRPPDVRDRFMADNVLELLRSQPEVRMTLWAANAHVAAESFLDWEATGVHLQKALGTQYTVIGFAFNRGAVHAFGDDPFAPVKAIPVELALPGSVDETLARVGQRAFLVDLRAPAAAADDETARWLQSKHRTHDMGASYSDVPSDEYWPLVTPRAAYDALIYFDEITPSHLRHPRPRFVPDAHPQPVNLTFVPSREAPAGWSLQERSLRSGYRVQTVADGCAEGRACALLDRPGTIEVPHYGSLTQDIDAAPYRAHKVRFSANVRLERLDKGLGPQQAELYVVAVGAEGETLALSGMPERPITVNAWQRHAVTLTVPPAAARVRFGIAVDGNVRAWLDDGAVERVD